MVGTIFDGQKSPSPFVPKAQTLIGFAAPLGALGGDGRVRPGARPAFPAGGEALFLKHLSLLALTAWGGRFTGIREGGTEFDRRGGSLDAAS